jgi:hypothetical protein
MEAVLDETMEAVRFRCEQRLGHLGEVLIEPRYYGVIIGVALCLPDGRRHAVMFGVEPWISPVEFADAASDRLLEWHAKL